MRTASTLKVPSQIMLTMYGAWIEGSTEADIEAIKRSMQASATAEEIYGAESPPGPLNPHAGATKVPLQGGLGTLKLSKNQAFQQDNWRSGRPQPSPASY
jgi:hypothetical protein